MTNKGLDIDSFWEYGNPAGSEERFRKALETAVGDHRLELLTQIARTYGLRDQFDKAHNLLDEIETQLDKAGPRPRVRTLLERGRSFNSGGEPEKARALFEQAWEQAKAAGEEGLAVDAAHMVAITYAGKPEGITWNQRGLALARPSTDPKAQALIPAMLNNSAWDLHDMGRYDEALPIFKEAFDTWTNRQKPPQMRIAKWAVARCLRSLGRHQEALIMLRELEAEHAAIDSTDGYLFEELAENLAALNQQPAAKPYFQKAFDTLSKNQWFAKHEATRLARLAEQAQS